MKAVRRSIAGVAAAALSTTGLAVLGVATAPHAHAEEVNITDASFVWGLNGYAQKGIFGPWTYKDLDGNVAQLTGSVSGGDQTEYAVEPVPVTSMPASSPQKTPNAIKFTAGTGTADPETGEVDLTWDGSYTVNAYPPQFNAPNEIYSDPELSLDAEGNGELTMNFTLGEGVDISGNPTAAEDFGRLTLLTFSDGSVDETAYGEFRAAPDYQGVEVNVPEDGSAQNRTCTADNGATGWWGAWPEEFLNAIPSSVRPHFYSTGCGGMQDLKPALPIDVDLGIEEPAPDPAVVVLSNNEFAAEGTHTVTVTGTGFDPALATGTRPPLAGKPSGTYVVFGKFAEGWTPSSGAPGSTRVNSSQKWAVLAADMATIGGPDRGAIELKPDGSFEATLDIDKAAIDAAATDPSLVNYGIYTYAGGGAVQPAYETYTPISFTAAETAPIDGNLRTAWGAKPTPSKTGKYTAKITGGGHVGVERFTITVQDAAGKVVETRTSAVPDATGRARDTRLSKRLPGVYTVTVTYPGDENLAPATYSEKLTVAKVKGTMRSAWVRKPTSRRTGAITAKLTGAGVGPAKGRFTVQVKNAKGKVIETRRARLDKTGRAKAVALKKRSRGTYTVVVSYAGNAHFKASTLKVRFKVKK